LSIRECKLLGLALRQVRRFEEAITACQDAAAIFRETEDRHREGVAVNNLKLAQAAKAEANSGK
jgi:hypothetical protein